MLAVSRSLENPDASKLLTLHQTIYILMRNVRGVYGIIAPQALCGTQEQPADLIPRPRPDPCRLTRQHVSTSWLTMTPLLDVLRPSPRYTWTWSGSVEISLEPG
jgi:hypothetical protein